MLATIWGGGMVMRVTSRSGLMPPDASQYRIHMACVPGGKVMAKVMGAPLAFASSTIGLSCWGVFTPLSDQFLVQGDGLPVPVEVEGNDHRLHRRPCRPMVEAYGHTEQHVGRLVLAQRETVADHRPRGFLRDRRLDPVLLEEPELVRHDDGRAVGERDDADAHLGVLGRVLRVRAPPPSGGHAGKQRGRRRASENLASSQLIRSPPLAEP